MASTLAVDAIKSTSGGAATFTLPTADGTAGQVLQTNASGVLSFTAVDGGKGSDVASASPTVIPDGDLYYIVTGTTGFSAFTVSVGRHFFVQFAGALVMTHHATNLDLPGEASITTVAGDVAEFFATAANQVHCVNYTRASGGAVKIADESIDSDAYVDGSIDNAHIADDAIDSEHYADGSIDNAHIADDAIDSEHYADGSIDLAHLSADCVDGTKIADDAIDSEHYTDGSIDNAHIADDAIDSEHYADGSIDNAHIADDAIDSEHYAAASIDAEHLAVGKDGALSLDGSPDTDHTANGPQTNTFASGYSSTIMDLVYMGSGGKWLEADSDATGTSINLLGIALEAKTDTQAMNVALPCSFVRDDTWAWTIGVPLYVSGTLGAITETKPSGSGDVVRTVGFAVHADMIYFNPSPDYVTLA
tara:strand:+ start:2012 stop:3271 length:1260 start_codon:yes stop_codon:yes gene_type:complete